MPPCLPLPRDYPPLVGHGNACHHAVGLALLLVVMLKKENAAYLLAGFVIMVITNCQNILPIAVIAGCIAYVNFTRDTETAKLTAASAATAAQEGDFEDGI